VSMTYLLILLSPKGLLCLNFQKNWIADCPKVGLKYLVNDLTCQRLLNKGV